MEGWRGSAEGRGWRRRKDEAIASADVDTSELASSGERVP
jgi:hypothetical protein